MSEKCIERAESLTETLATQAMDTCLQLRALVAEKGNIHVTGTSNKKIYIYTLVCKQNTLKASS